MTIGPIRYLSFDDPNHQDVSFDDAATSAMGEAFDRTCRSLHQFGTAVTVRETIAKWFIEAAKNGERDYFSRLYEQAHEAFGITDFSMPFVIVGRDPPVPAYASVAHTQRDPREPLRRRQKE
jgi:hypothetical protein